MGRGVTEFSSRMHAVVENSFSSDGKMKEELTTRNLVKKIGNWIFWPKNVYRSVTHPKGGSEGAPPLNLKKLTFTLNLTPKSPKTHHFLNKTSQFDFWA